MKKQKILAIVYIVLVAISLLAYMGLFFLLMRKQFTVAAFINYWLTFALAISGGFVLYHWITKIFVQPKKHKTFYNMPLEWIFAWMAILILVVVASIVCWQDYFVNTFIPKLTATPATSQLGPVIKLLLPTSAIFFLLALLVVPQFLALLFRAKKILQAKKKKSLKKYQS